MSEQKNEGCCLWTAEQWDDSLKALFIADAHYKNGNRTEASATLRAQFDTRMPELNRRAAGECGREVRFPESLRKEIVELEDDIFEGMDYARIHNKVIDIDRRHAPEGYRAFAKCMSD
jgi:hypothetical protein